jgi:hypothetical protein
MDAPTTITALFPGNRTEVFSTFTFKEVAKILKQRNYSAAQEPLLLSIAGRDKSLYYDSQVIATYVNDPEGWEYLHHTLWCDGLYRNIGKLISGKTTVDPDSLWLKRSSILLLYDNDDSIWSDFNVHENLFYKIA